MVFIGNILYQSVTKCNKIVYLEKKKKIRKGREKNVTRATNGFI